MRAKLLPCLLWLLAASRLVAQQIDRLSYPPPAAMTRADIWFAQTTKTPRAALILCPGMNGSGEDLIRDSAWQAFARQNNLALVGISFASRPEDMKDGRGYPFPEQGSGPLLLNAIRQKFGRNIPLLLYGFSSGAYFTELFVQWKPDAVLSWCSHAAGYYEKKPCLWPAGIVSCGQKDVSRYGTALSHFKNGRATGGKLLWIGLPDCAHQRPAALDAFVRHYFAAILQRDNQALWVDIDTEKILADSEARIWPSLSGWLPSRSLVQDWQKLNEP